MTSAHPYHVLAIDLDGTLLRSDKTVSSRTMAAIDRCKRNGMKLVIATARPPRNMIAMVPEELHNDPWICYNGAEIRMAYEPIYQNTITPEIAHGVIQSIQTLLPHCTVTVEMNNHLFADGPLNHPIEYTIANLLEVVTRPVAKILFDLPPGSDPKPVLNALPQSCRAMVTDQGSLVQIAHHTVSKTSALKVLLDRWQITFEQVIAFGDDVNDIDMLTTCGMGIAMGNAVPAVKAIADRETASNDEDGIAHILEELI